MNYYVNMPQSVKTNIVDILSDLVSYKTVNGNTAAMQHCFEYLEKHLVSSNLKVTRLTSNKLPSLFATSRPTRSPKVLLQAHIDVVPAKSTCFTLKQQHEILYGRGVFDMKFAAACYVQLARELKDELDQYDFGLLFTSDEEIGGENGVGYVLNKGYRADICILPDAGDDWHIEATCNAVWLARLSANGQTAHGSRPWEGTNAINKLVEGLAEVQKLFGALKPYKNSLTISQISGGKAMNQVPDQAEATLDMRFVNDNEYSKHRAKLEAMAKKRELELKTVAHVKAREVDMQQPEVEQFLNLASEIRGKPITPIHSFGASDACYFAKHGIPVIVIRPRGGGAHSNNEWLHTYDLQQFYQLLKAYIVQTTSIPH